MWQLIVVGLCCLIIGYTVGVKHTSKMMTNMFIETLEGISAQFEMIKRMDDDADS